MKKVLAFLILTALLVASINTAAIGLYTESSYKMTVNNAVLLSKRYEIDGETYVDIYDIAHIYDKFVIPQGEEAIILSDTPDDNPHPNWPIYTYRGIEGYNGSDVATYYYNDLKMLSFTLVWNICWEEYNHVHAEVPCAYYPSIMRYKNHIDPVSKLCCAEATFFGGRYPSMFIPKESYEKFMALVITDMPLIRASEITVYLGDKAHSMRCKMIDGRLYSPITSLSEIFGFDVEFNDDEITITDDKLIQNSAPDGINVYYINGMRFVKPEEIEPLLERYGYIGQFKNCGIMPCQSAYGYFVLRRDFIERYYSEGCGGLSYEDYKYTHWTSSVPYINNTDILDEAISEEHIYVMYDYFINIGLLK